MKKRLTFFSVLFLSFLLLFCTTSCLEINITPSGNKATDSVTFYLDGKKLETVLFAEDGTLTAPTVTVPAGYRFDGWYADATYKKQYKDTDRAYGRLLAVTYTLSYELDGGCIEAPTSYTVKDKAFTLPQPQKNGYTFVGWLTEGVEDPVATVRIPQGTSGDLNFRAVWTPTEYTITYDLDGGYAENPTVYTVETETFSLSEPLRFGYLFYGWEWQGNVTSTLSVLKGTTGNLTIRAVWRTGDGVYSYTSDPAGMTLTSDTRAGNVEGNTPITLSAPAYVDGLRFAGWKCNGTYYATAETITFYMGNGNMAFTAVYDEDQPYSYDRATGGALSISTGHTSTPTAIYGGSAHILSDASYSYANVTLSASYLQSLPLGEYRFFVDDVNGGGWFHLAVTDSRKGVKDLRINYDTNAFPKAAVTFTCDCGGSHTYSLDGAAGVNCKSGDAITGYTKNQAHTLKVTCSDGSFATVSRKAMETLASTMYSSSFTYGGNTYDYVIETEDEYVAFVSYIILVEGVLDYQNDPSAELSYKYWASDDLLQIMNDETKNALLSERAFSGQSFPMLPAMRTTYSTLTPNAKTVILEYRTGLNTVLSTQKKSTVEDTMGRLPTSARRPADYNGFKINSYPEISIRTLYELESMPCGYKPVFAETASDAATAYSAAKDVLRTMVSDTMTDAEKVEAIYLWLGYTLTYDTVAYTAGDDASKYRSFTSYGALVDHLAVCDGYASAFRLMCQIEGIVCEEVTGRKSLSDEASGHAWNVYTIDGVTYAADATWARVNDTTVTLAYCMMNEKTLLASGHYAHASFSDRYTEQVADGTMTPYTRIVVSLGCDLDIASSDEFTAAVRYMKEHGITTMELHISKGNWQTYLNEAYDTLKVSLSASAMEDAGVCFVTLK